MNSDVDTGLVSQINLIRKKGCNFQTIKRKIGEDRLKEFINSIYPKFSITEIEVITGIPDSTLQYWFQQLGIPFIRNHIINLAIPGNKKSQVIISKGGITKKVSMIKITPELAYVIGFALGDGNIQKYMVDVFNKDKKLREHLFRLLKPYGPITEQKREDGLWKLRLSSVKIANLIKDEKGIRKDTINHIFDCDNLARRFIAAFWDAEGTVRKQGKYYHLYLYNSDEYLINKIKNFLTIKKIRFSILSRIDDKRIYFLKGRQVKANKVIYRLSIPKSSNHLWINEIGIHLMHSKKSKVVEEMINKHLGGKKNE